MKSPDILKKMWVSIFNRRGGSGTYTINSDEIGGSLKEWLRNRLSLKSSELPVIIGFKTPKKWFVLTTERLVWELENKITELEVSKIKDATVSLVLENTKGVTKKNEFSFLKIITFDDEYTLEVESGNPHIGLWNLLKTIAASNSKLTN
ncbi:MAG: hypothetical protein JNN15_16395 [Blastocatellia bacterium]|nr:hypothetical protein [Blastocatellia bacterium]